MGLDIPSEQDKKKRPCEYFYDILDTFYSSEFNQAASQNLRRGIESWLSARGKVGPAANDMLDRVFANCARTTGLSDAYWGARSMFIPPMDPQKTLDRIQTFA